MAHQKTTYKYNYPPRPAKFGKSRFGAVRFGEKKTQYTKKYSKRNTSYNKKYS